MIIAGEAGGGVWAVIAKTEHALSRLVLEPEDRFSHMVIPRGDSDPHEFEPKAPPLIRGSHEMNCLHALVRALGDLPVAVLMSETFTSFEFIARTILRETVSDETKSIPVSKGSELRKKYPWGVLCRTDGWPEIVSTRYGRPLVTAHSNNYKPHGEKTFATTPALAGIEEGMDIETMIGIISERYLPLITSRI